MIRLTADQLYYQHFLSPKPKPICFKIDGLWPNTTATGLLARDREYFWIRLQPSFQVACQRGGAYGWKRCIVEWSICCCFENRKKEKKKTNECCHFMSAQLWLGSGGRQFLFFQSQDISRPFLRQNVSPRLLWYKGWVSLLWKWVHLNQQEPQPHTCQGPVPWRPPPLGAPACRASPWWWSRRPGPWSAPAHDLARWTWTSPGPQSNPGGQQTNVTFFPTVIVASGWCWLKCCFTSTETIGLFILGMGMWVPACSFVYILLSLLWRVGGAPLYSLYILTLYLCICLVYVCVCILYIFTAAQICSISQRQAGSHIIVQSLHSLYSWIKNKMQQWISKCFAFGGPLLTAMLF